MNKLILILFFSLHGFYGICQSSLIECECLDSVEISLDGEENNRNGIWRCFYDNGKQKSIAYYTNNSIDSLISFWDLRGEKTVDKGDGFSVEISKEGDSSITFYQNGKKSMFKLYLESGRLLLNDSYLNGQLHGDAIRNYPDQGKESHENYQYGKLHGIQKYWHKNGVIRNISNYQFGTLNGVYAEYTEKGDTLVYTQFVAGNILGEYKEFHSNGNLKASGIFVNQLKDTLIDTALVIDVIKESFNEISDIEITNISVASESKEGIWKVYDNQGRLEYSLNYYPFSIVVEFECKWLDMESEMFIIIDFLHGEKRYYNASFELIKKEIFLIPTPYISDF